ncbi:hypothetical protein [Metasolibacillus meyeri]
MHTIKTGSRLLNPFYRMATKFHFLFPESGRNIPLRTVVDNITKPS